MGTEERYECLKLENQLCFPLYACAKEVVRRYRPLLDELGITYTQYITMMVMWEHRSMSVKDIGEVLCLDSGTLTPLLKKLEEKGYIVRRRDDNDERILVASVTEEGLALRDKAVNIPREIASCIPLQAKDAIELARILNELKKNLSTNSE